MSEAVWAFVGAAWAFQACLAWQLLVCLRREGLGQSIDPMEWDKK